MTGDARPGHRSRILISIHGTVAVAYCFGTLDRSVVQDLVHRVRALTRDGVLGLVCSLERVSHIHFQALDALLGLHQEMREAGGRLILAAASPYLRQILDFGGVPVHVAVVADRSQAVEELLETGKDSRQSADEVSVQPSFF